MSQAEIEGTGKRRHHRTRRAFLSHGDVPLVLLGLLSEHSMHGYEMIKSLEERSGGLYKPSAGAIYPTLSMLEDQELIESVPQGRKRVFSITGDGRDYLAKHGEGDLWRSILTNAVAQADEAAEPQDPACLRNSIKNLFLLFFEASSAVGDDPDRLAQLERIIAATADDLNALMSSD